MKEVMRTMPVTRTRIVAGGLMTAMIALGVAGVGLSAPAPGAAKKGDEASSDAKKPASGAEAHRITVVTEITDASSLPVGARCRVELMSETDDANNVVEVVYEGEIVEATAREVVLAVSWARRMAKNPSVVSDLPVVKRFFTNVGVSRPRPGEEKRVRIPAGKIRSVNLDRSDKP